MSTRESTIKHLKAKLDFSHAQRVQLQGKYDELGFDHESLERGKELSDQQVVQLKNKMVLLEKDLATSKQMCEKQKKSLKSINEQKQKSLQVKGDLKAKKKENEELKEKVKEQQKLEEKVTQWKKAYNNLLSDYDALQKELQATKPSGQGVEENAS